jgi:hypothetical protein
MAQEKHSSLFSWARQEKKFYNVDTRLPRKVKAIKNQPVVATWTWNKDILFDIDQFGWVRLG